MVDSFPGCRKEEPQPTGWLKTTEVCSLSVLEVRSPNSRCLQGHAASETLGRILPRLVQLPVVAGSPGCGHVTPTSASVVSQGILPASVSVSVSPLFFWLHCAACEILAPRPGIEPMPPALGARSLNHWTTREVPRAAF